MDIGTQTLDHNEYINHTLPLVQRMVASFETNDNYFLNVRLPQIEFREQQNLVKLSAEVDEWYSEIKEWRLELDKIHTTMLGLQRRNSVQGMRSHADDYYIQGMHLLAQVNQWTEDDEPKNLADALVSLRAHCRMCMSLSRGLGALEVWIMIVKMREKEVPADEDPTSQISDEELHVSDGEESFVEQELLGL